MTTCSMPHKRQVRWQLCGVVALVLTHGLLRACALARTAVKRELLAISPRRASHSHSLQLSQTVSGSQAT